jgi:hypothetical protein
MEKMTEEVNVFFNKIYIHLNSPPNQDIGDQALTVTLSHHAAKVIVD